MNSSEKNNLLTFFNSILAQAHSEAKQAMSTHEYLLDRIDKSDTPQPYVTTLFHVIETHKSKKELIDMTERVIKYIETEELELLTHEQVRKVLEG